MVRVRVRARARAGARGEAKVQRDITVVKRGSITNTMLNTVVSSGASDAESISSVDMLREGGCLEVQIHPKALSSLAA